MATPRISREEFQSRIHAIQGDLERRGLDALVVYGDEYRKENLRYVCNFWPIFERGACFIPRAGDPILAGAPEAYARALEEIGEIGASDRMAEMDGR